MSTVGRLHRVMAAGGLVIALGLAGCSGGDDGTPDGGAPAFTVDMMQAGVLQPTDIGGTWVRPEQTPPTTSVIPFCAGSAPRPQAPGSPSAIASSLIDEGRKGAQAFDQTGLVYPDAATAASAAETLRATADACAPTVTQPSRPGEEGGVLPGYTETTKVEPLASAGWSGFVVVRHRVYEATAPGVGDTVVAVLTQENAVVVASYGVFWVGRQATAPEFTNDWRRLVGTVLNRVDEKKSGKSPATPSAAPQTS